MAYYPDGRQEQLLFEHDAHRYVDLLHMMSYDQGGEQHSSYAFGKLAVKLVMRECWCRLLRLRGARDVEEESSASNVFPYLESWGAILTILVGLKNEGYSSSEPG